MVKVREEHLLTADGSVDLNEWLKKIDFDDESDRALIKSACKLSKEYGESEPTYTGESCFHQGLVMAEILNELGLDSQALAAAIVFNSVHYGRLSLDKVTEKLSLPVTKLVIGVGKMDAIWALRDKGTTRMQSDSTRLDNLRKMLLAMVEDVRVVLIKLAEHVCILRDAREMSEHDRFQVAKQAQDIFAPLANRLGVGQIKWEIEDLAFRYLHAKSYKRIAQLLDERRVDRERWIEKVKDSLTQALKEDAVEAEVSGRVKHIYSIWRKMKRKDTSFHEIYDVRAVRILVNSVRDCYSALGTVHRLWQHVPKEFDDYIAMPKENGYRSLHTAVIAEGGKTLEVQIRTADMHQDSELGVAAHWRYKEGGTRDPGYERKIAWLRQLLDWQEEVTDADEFMDEFRTNALDERVYVLTPVGDVVDLIVGSTPLDFAYNIHTEVGHRCRGAKVNGRIVPLTYVLSTGEHVEILTAPHMNPSRDWMNANLGYLASSRSRAKVHQWFKRQNRDKNIADGRIMMDHELRRLGMNRINYKEVASRLNLMTEDDVLAALGAGDLKPTQVLNAAHTTLSSLQHNLVQIPQTIRNSDRQDIQTDDITISGVGNLMTQIAQCCKPVPGDPIVGYITQGRGVSIHREDCANILHIRERRQERMIQVDWGGGRHKTYPIDVLIIAYDRTDLLRDITALLSNEHINVLALNTEISKKDNTATFLLTLGITDVRMLARILERLNQLPNVIDIKRQR